MPTPEAAPPGASGKAGSTVLFVDDERDMRKLVTFVLGRQGYRVLTAENGVIGLATLRAEHPDAVILDLMMPEMNGHEVLRQVKADPATQDIPIVVLTAMGREQDLALSISLGALSHLEKPYQAQELLREVERAVAQHRSVHPASSQPQHAEPAQAPPPASSV